MERTIISLSEIDVSTEEELPLIHYMLKLLDYQSEIQYLQEKVVRAKIDSFYELLETSMITRDEPSSTDEPSPELTRVISTPKEISTHKRIRADHEIVNQYTEI